MLSILLQPHGRIPLHKRQIDLMPQQLPYIPDPILNHRRPLQTQPPPIHAHLPRQPHRLQHLRAEHAAIADFHPLALAAGPAQAGVEAEYFQGRLRVGVVGGLEAEPMDAHLREEDFHEADEAAEGEAVVGDHAFDLVEFREVGGVDGFVAEDPVDGEVAGWAGVGCAGMGRGDGLVDKGNGG